MPLYNYICNRCGEKRRKMLTVEQESKTLQVCKCRNEMVRDHQPPGSQVMEVLDSGFQVKKLERPAEAQRLYKERSKIDPFEDK